MQAQLVCVSAVHEGGMNKRDRFLNRCKSLNYCSQTTSHVAELFDVADQSLFKTVLSNSHHRLLPINKISVYYLRSRAHNLTLTIVNRVL